MNQPFDLQAARHRIDEIRLSQARHQISVNRWLSILKSKPGTDKAETAQQELNALNYHQQRHLEERNQLEQQIRDENIKQNARRDHQNNIRQIVCALLTEQHRGPSRAVIEEAITIEEEIQNL